MRAGAVKRRIYCTISAQQDNLGDILIRQHMLELVDPRYCVLRVSVGSMPQEYIDTFDLPEDTKVYRSRVKFGLAFLGSTLARRSSLLLPPGPHPANSWRAAVVSLSSAVASLAVRLAGGRSVTVGKSVSGNHRMALLAERILVKSSNVYATRDFELQRNLGTRVERLPDLAFLGQRTENDKRPYTVLSLRYDRSPNEEFVASVIDWSRSRGLEPVFVTQVGRDSMQHARLASQYNVDHVDWNSGNFKAQTDRLIQLYSQAAMVITDRLHVSILAALSGAIPIAVTYGSGPSKLQISFEDVLTICAVDQTALGTLECLDESLSSGNVMAQELDAARLILEERVAEIRRLLT